MEELLKHLLGDNLTKHFDLEGVEKRDTGKDGGELILKLKEKIEMIPTTEDGITLESKGFYDPLELIGFPVGESIAYLHIYRRKWRDKTTHKIYSNQYDLRFPGTKLTKEFADFLKEEDRKGKISEFQFLHPDLWNLIKEDFYVVQKSSVGVREPWYKRITSIK